MKRLNEISDEEIRRADWVNAVDPVYGQWETVWGLDEVPPAQPHRQSSILDVALARDDFVGLLNLIDRVEQSHGRLAPRVQALRQTLKLTAADQSNFNHVHVYSDQDLATVLE